MNLEAFIAELIEKHRSWPGCDFDGGELDAMLVKYGLCIRRSASKREAEAWRKKGFLVCAGDDLIVDSDELAALRARVREAA